MRKARLAGERLNLLAAALESSSPRCRSRTDFVGGRRNSCFIWGAPV